MKIELTASSNYLNYTIIESESIDKCIKDLSSGNIDISNIIDKDYSSCYDENTNEIVNCNNFVVTILTAKDRVADVSIEIYDTYRE